MDDLENADPDPAVQRNLEAVFNLWAGPNSPAKPNNLQAYNDGFAAAIEAIQGNRGTAFGHKLVMEVMTRGMKIVGDSTGTGIPGDRSTIHWNFNISAAGGTPAIDLGHEFVHVTGNLLGSDFEERRVSTYENMLRYEQHKTMRKTYQARNNLPIAGGAARLYLPLIQWK